MLAMRHNIYRLLFVTCRDKGNADKRVLGICYCCPDRQSLVPGVRCDGCDLNFCLISVQKYQSLSQETLGCCMGDRICYSPFDKYLSCVTLRAIFRFQLDGFRYKNWKEKVQNNINSPDFVMTEIKFRVALNKGVLVRVNTCRPFAVYRLFKKLVYLL